MAMIIGFHKLVLKPGVNAADFEKFMRSELFPGLSIVFQVDKTITHGFTQANWLSSEHLLLRGDQDGEGGSYLWMIIAQVDDEKVSDEKASALEQEAKRKVQEFFDLGSSEETIAAVKLRPFATRTSFGAYLEVGRRKPNQT